MQDREIKFRAWDGSRMVHFEDFSIGLTKGKKVKPYVYFLSDTFNGEVKLGKHKIMQWTGLLDKNGIEIFEGDILKESVDGIFEVIWDNTWARFKLDYTRTNKNIQYPEWNRGTNMVIIGNIYESPYLLSAAAKTEAKPVL